jgi:hypothetical protein
MQQAILLDIAIIIPGLFRSLGQLIPIPAELAVVGGNTVFYTMAGVIGYSIFCNIQGKTPNEVPILSQAAEAAIGPF